MDANTGLFTSALPYAGAAKETWLDGALRTEFPRIAAEAKAREDYFPELCPLADVGQYIVRVLQILSKLTDHLINGSFVGNYVNGKLSSLIDEDDGSVSEYIDDKHQALGKIARQIKDISKDCGRVWSSSPAPPFHLQSHPSGLTAYEPYPVNTAPPSITETAAYSSGPAYEGLPTSAPNLYGDQEYTSVATRAGHAGSLAFGEQRIEDIMAPTTDYSHQGQDNPSIDQLKSRGKGQYTCPHGLDCKKGGVKSDGRIRVFTRNHEFR
ncbi:uncharacterized protein KY384_003366 [Bacidia gigantensis]|uniref:uncharacterized protein n=1 Tax=Bacidia gigantensis TaxID=2732470 RepID=UPI001D048BD6|nr:uncharacterized protein KY384_003366 [Bacidia gigantensis]KAG8531734.1 hypothetical protein KY384_003366 [Bacidia gigantensis]